ncbi:MAG: J domain-containing protein [Verrucomicrobiaceae bacterium]
MSDPFAVLGVERKLELDPEELSARYRELSKVHHPDLGGEASDFERVGKAYAELNSPARRVAAAVATISDCPEERGTIPAVVMDRFSQVAGLIEKVDSFVEERGRAKSALARALLDAKIPVLQGALQEELAGIGLLEDQMTGRFGDFDRNGWENRAAEMAEVARGLVFLEKWEGQLKAQSGKLFQSLLGG